MDQPFIVGVNYWPRKKAMYWWSNFDPGEVWDEFTIIKDLGLKIVRIFLMWEDFQPKPNEISFSLIKNLEKVCDIAYDKGLELDVTFFTGHMSGPNWVPGWMVNGVKPKYIKQVVSGGRIIDIGYMNPYSEPLVLEAQKLQLKTIVTALKDHPGIRIWNLGNEPDIFAYPSSEIEGLRWASDLFQTIREIDSMHPVTCGLHMASLFFNNGLRVDQIFSKADIAVMHAYPMYAEGLVSDPLDTDFVPFTCALTSALSGKPVLMEEFGGCTAPPGKESFYWEWAGYGDKMRQYMASEEAITDYFSTVLPKLVDAGAIGALIWCFADYHPSIWDRPPCSDSWHERYFGLVRPDGSLKPHAQVIKDFIATEPVVKPPIKTILLPYDGDGYYQNTLEKLLNLYEVWKSSS
jgi:endo-1,4-beta-mannosidase